MRHFLGILALSVALTFVARGQYDSLPPPQPVITPPQIAVSMIGFSAPNSEGGQLITLIDTSQKVMSVYHIDSRSGEITLRSVRRLVFDFAIEEFNATEPLPADIRQMLGRGVPK